MAASSGVKSLEERETILDYVYNSYNTERDFGLSPLQLQNIFENLRGISLNLSQIKAAMKYICAFPSICDREELFDILNEMDRRYFLAQDLQWEFALLDRQRKGAISKSDTMFLFQMVYGDFFSKHKFERMMSKRVVPESHVSFPEIEAALCNIPTHEWIDELIKEDEKERKAQEFERMENKRKHREAEEALKKEEELKRQMAEEDKRLREMLAKKKEKKLKAEKDSLEAEKAEQDRLAAEKAEQDRMAAEKAEQDRLIAEKAEQDRLAAEKAEQDRLAAEKAEQDRLAAEKAEQDRMAAEKAEQDRLIAEKAEQDRMAAEKAEQDRLTAEKAEQDRLAAEKAEQDRMATENKKHDRALKNWKLAKKEVKVKLHRERMKQLNAAKEKSERDDASKQTERAEQALLAEKTAEEELINASKAIETASNEEEKRKAEEAQAKAKKAALRNKEKRLRSTLKATCKLKSKPRIDAAVVEANEALPVIPTLKPDIEVAEKVSDSIKCGDDLDDAMARRSLEDINVSVTAIKSKGFETDHVGRLQEAEKLAQKLKRLERLKKEIMALDQRTISEIRSYKKPLPAVQNIMIATYIILGYKEKDLKEWKYIQALLGKTGKEGLKRQCTTLDATKINMSAAGVADKKYLSNHDLDSVTDVSAGAATFFVWSTAMIEEARSWHDDSEFREKLMEKKRKEDEEAKMLEEEKKNRKSKDQTRRKSVEGGNKDKPDKTLTAPSSRRRSLSSENKTPKKRTEEKSQARKDPSRKTLKTENNQGSRGRSKSPARTR